MGGRGNWWGMRGEGERHRWGDGVGRGHDRAFGGAGVERPGRIGFPRERETRSPRKAIEFEGAEKRGCFVLFGEIQKEDGPTDAHARWAECDSPLLGSEYPPEYLVALGAGMA